MRRRRPSPLSVAAPAADEPGTDEPAAVSSTALPDPMRAFSTADIEFLASMLSHHAVARQIAQLAEQRAVAPEVRAFASTLQAAQQPESDQMERWLIGLGVDPATIGSAHDHDGATSQRDIDDLERLSGRAFDATVLQMLSAHSISATTLANAEVSEGFNTAVRQLAARIAERQWADMRKIRDLG